VVVAAPGYGKTPMQKVIDSAPLAKEKISQYQLTML